MSVFCDIRDFKDDFNMFIKEKYIFVHGKLLFVSFYLELEVGKIVIQTELSLIAVELKINL